MRIFRFSKWSAICKYTLKICSVTMNSVSFTVVILLVNFISAYEYVGDCYFYSYSCPEKCNITFICVENEIETKFFKQESGFNCKNYGHISSKSVVGTINFVNCEQPSIPSNMLELYTSVHTYNNIIPKFDNASSG